MTATQSSLRARQGPSSNPGAPLGAAGSGSPTYAVRGPALVSIGNFFFRYRDAVSPALLFTLLVLTRPRLALGSARLDQMLDAAGLLMALAGQALRIAVVGYAYIVRGGKGRKVYAEDLVTGGLFATARNPLYVGNLLIYFGLLVVWNSPWAYLVGVTFYLFLYRSIVAAEEAFLLGRFGAAYERYCRDVGRWIPDLRRLPEGLEGMTFNWRRVVLKEYGTVAAWMLAALVLLALETLTFSPPAARAPEIAVLAGVAAPVVSLWALARWLKLSRRLRG